MTKECPIINDQTFPSGFAVGFGAPLNLQGNENAQHFIDY
jgi:hypothetical protein